VLRAYRGVIQSGGNGMGQRHLSIFVLEHVSIGTVEHPRAAQPEAPHTPPPKESPPQALPISTTAHNRPSPKRRGWILGLAAAIMIALALGVVSFRQPQRLAGWKASLAATGKVLLGESEGDLPPPKNKEPAAITTPATPDPPPSREPVKPAVVPQNPVFHAPPANQAGGPAVRSGNPPTTAETGGASALAIMPPSPAASFPGKGAIIGFEQNSNELFTEHLAILDRLAGHLKDHPTYRVKLTGHTDVAGSAAYNLSVSRFRANIVQAYLVGKGISADRMVIEAFGPLKPAASNETRTGREMNRRVEIEVIEE